MWCQKTTETSMVPTMTRKASNFCSGSSHGISVTSGSNANDNMARRLEVSSEQTDYYDGKCHVQCSRKNNGETFCDAIKISYRFSLTYNLLFVT